MQIITEPAQMQLIAEKLRLNRQLVGVVMTMGALHEGHLSLVKLAQECAGTVILTIFVNPRQFGLNEDLHRYPRPFEKDVALAKAAGVDYLFAPEAETIYPENFSTTVQCGALAERLEGAQRPGHFNGVATVVTKLFHITKPHVAIFGEKDAQQLAIIRTLAGDLNLDIKIVGAPVIREENGLAVSSRNIYLTSEERRDAAVLHRGILHAEKRVAEGETKLHTIAGEIMEMISSTPGFRADYVEFVDEEGFEPAETAGKGKEYRLLLAAWAGSVRLIDNGRIHA
ncbi:pantoate--beta-alanine ligase [Chlorobium sp. BLA1]|uniref:pantoate--beta-alanine ligase n=1 Tax=Candidatus Chlorobium masyuteum TaxID=2716876 RepID=UPI0014235F86|nr:pantoate--beta-alanine ligase [Candidatus Chlorobium masyuteum]NHQ59138.1 pantoate--beta-alanine ligase [Candidatus Chlorobium masyuteum]NTU44257.1 pantoate--beta-alanine ligase [Chlorobiaceae bacterium]